MHSLNPTQDYKKQTFKNMMDSQNSHLKPNLSEFLRRVKYSTWKEGRVFYVFLVQLL